MRQITIKCRYCDTLLAGRDQFIGHMVHAHEIEYGVLESTWQSLAQTHAAHN